MVLLLYQYGPAVVSLLLALGVWVLSRRSHTEPLGTARIPTALGMLLALGCTITYSSWIVFPTWIPSLDEDGFLAIQLVGYVLPLVLTAAALLFLVWPSRSTGSRGPAELAPRTLTTFASKPWSIALAAVTVAVIVVSVIAGLASTPDEDGRYLLYGLEPSGEIGSSTTIYGWWFSLPCLALIGIIVAIALIELALISRPVLAIDRDRDVELRRARTRTVLAVSTAGMLLHLGDILSSLHGTSTLRLGIQTGAAGFVELGTSFAAIGPALLIASYLVVILGLTMWWGVLLSVIPIRKGQVRRPVRA